MSGPKKVKSGALPTVAKAIIATLGLGALAVWIYQLIHSWRVQKRPSSLEPIDFKLSHQGLSTAEVEARQTDEVFQARLSAEKEARKERIRKNVFSVFNVTILVLAISLVFLNDPLGALATIGTLVLSVAVNVFQETRAAKQVGMLASRTRPMAPVIRDGRLQSINQEDLVVGDVLVAGRGDEILADGVLLESANLIINESKNGKGGESSIKEPGDVLTAGTYCGNGWVVYQVSRLNIQVPEEEDPASLVASIRVKTPLQKIIERVLYVLLVIVAIFYIFFFLEVVRIDLLPPELMTTYREVMSIIFSILPSGLLLMIVINYAVGSADIARSDVLVHNSQTIESLAQVSTVGFIRHGGAMGLTIELEMLPLPEDTQKLSERRVRLALGNYVHSIPGENYPLSIIKDHLDGEPRQVHQQARYLSLYGWEAMTFSSADMPGSFVIGYPETLAPYLLQPQPPPEVSTEPSQNKTGGLKARLGKLFNKEQSDKKKPVDKPSAGPVNQAVEWNISEVDIDEQEQSDEKGFLKGFRQRIGGVFRRKEKEEEPTEISKGPEKIRRLLFAYSPIKQAIYEEDFTPQCPNDLTPLCNIKFVDEVRPEVKRAVEIFKEEDISIKIFTQSDANNSLVLANQLGITETDSDDSSVVSGGVILKLAEEELWAEAKDKTIFAEMNSDQQIRVIQALQAQGEHVAVLGTSINDIDVMQAANLSITNKGGGETILDQADLIMLKNSFKALTESLQKGQRIVNSVMDVLKLNLSRIGYTLILVLVMYALGERTFFYHPAQGGIVNLFTVVLPSIALSLWASPKTVDGKNISRLLFHFISPAALLTALAVILIRFIFSRFGADVLYTQLAVTHGLVLMGLLLVLFAQPPIHFLVAGDDFSGNWQPPLAALVFLVLFHLMTLIPLAQRWFRIGPLESLRDYLLVLLVSLVWALLMVGIWRLLWPERFGRAHPRSDIGMIRSKKESLE